MASDVHTTCIVAIELCPPKLVTSLAVTIVAVTMVAVTMAAVVTMVAVTKMVAVPYVPHLRAPVVAHEVSRRTFSVACNGFA